VTHVFNGTRISATTYLNNICELSSEFFFLSMVIFCSAYAKLG